MVSALDSECSRRVGLQMCESETGLRELTGYEDCNYFLNDLVWEHGGPSEAILKVTNPLEAKSHDNIDFQVKLCDILNENGIPCPKTIKRVDGRDWALEEVVNGVRLPVRVFGVLLGSNLENFTFEASLVQDIGELLAKFHVIADESKLSVTHMPYIAVEHRRSILNEMELQLKNSIISKERSKLIAECLDEFERRVANNRQLHEVGLIHSDINETNLLITEENNKKKITGLLDFGDVHRSFRIVDIASTVLYLHLSDKLQQGVESLTRNILEGYRRVRALPLCTDLLTAMKARLSRE
ncbi:hypothetical protein Y032_0012g1717 [Ancylostoma ceylanicum]|uniref:Hydroxylysine kinase n=1 Tax=Ancylostoma ceylanicum TaxID=53326 RepID=A0A016VEI1_9BILA|nr:hypothetical protein Y032_0012g1717 [Ancylostoma ceylanicum]